MNKLIVNSLGLVSLSIEMVNPIDVINELWRTKFGLSSLMGLENSSIEMVNPIDELLPFFARSRAREQAYTYFNGVRELEYRDGELH